MEVSLCHPNFKAGKRSNPTNYRPVSLTSIVCKVMEHIFTSEIMKHLEAHSILAPCQFGFRSAHSCESQLPTVTDDLARALNNKLQIYQKHLIRFHIEDYCQKLNPTASQESRF